MKLITERRGLQQHACARYLHYNSNNLQGYVLLKTETLKDFWEILVPGNNVKTLSNDRRHKN